MSAPQLTLRSALFGAALLATPTLAAQTNNDAPYTPRRYESDQYFAAELRFTAYYPQVDDEFGGSGPYQEIFGDSVRLMVGGEFDWQALRLAPIGSLGVGLGGGFTRCSGKSPRTDGTGRSGEATSLKIIPLYLTAVARLDLLSDGLGIPLAPYAKLGAATALWSVRDGDGLADEGGVTGKGRSDGYLLAAGLALQLDFLDSSAAKSMDSTTGVNHSYLFGEWTMLDLGGSDQMQVGTNSWTAGLAIEF